MKTRMRRFWISVSLAAGSLALPLSGALRAHDLPTRWTSGANSFPSWNYLLDDCFDTPMLPGSQSLMDVESTTRRGTEDWASSCPAEWAADTVRDNRSANTELEGMLRNPISRFSKEMTCWVNEWQMIQHKANLAQEHKQLQLWASLPDNGNPPAPDYSLAYGPEYVGKYEPLPLADTCAFDAEYQARQTAAELLAREIARANEIAKYEARVTQSIVDAQRVAAVVEMDAIAVADAKEPASQAPGTMGSVLCGGEAREIMSAQCFPRQFSDWMPRVPFANDILDEYVAYDLEARDHHWLGGLGKSWKLHSALGASPTQTDLIVAKDNDEKDPWTEASEEKNEAPESFVAPDLVSTDSINLAYADSDDVDSDYSDSDYVDSDYVDSDYVDSDYVASDYVDSDYVASDDIESDYADSQSDSYSDDSDLAYDSAVNDAEIKAYLDSILYQARYRALSLIESARAVAEPMLPPADVVLPELLPNLGQSMAVASDWIEDQQCTIASELCGFDSAYRVGNWLGSQSLTATQLVFESTIVVAHYLDIPADIQPSLDVYVIYVDAEGNSLAVPSSLARAWNRPEVESEASFVAEPDYATQNMNSESGSLGNDSTDWVLLDQVRSQVVSMLANQLDSFGMQLLHASDLLNRWADTQIASRESEVR